MSRTIQFLIFISIFLFVYLGLNFYVSFRLSNLLNIKRNFLFYFIILFLTFSFPIAMFLERSLKGFFVDVFAIIGSTWMGILFLLFCSLLIYEILKFIIRIDKHTAGVIIIVFVLILTVYSIINASFINVKKVQIEIDDVNNLKIVQISDVHLGNIRNSDFLKRIVKKTNSLEPDIVVITGDLFDGGPKLNKDLISHIDEIQAPVYFVTGNHETYEGVDNVSNLLKDTKVNFLRNEVVNFRDIQIIGVDYSENRNYLGEILPKLNINKTKSSILLYHSPGGLKYSSENSIDLQLSGHTHNGQIIPFNGFVRLAYKYIKGLHKYNEMYLYVSQGTGTWGPPMRLGSRNEITFIEVREKDKI
ncbi:MAG: metallophosphoesterase [archaeon]